MSAVAPAAPTAAQRRWFLRLAQGQPRILVVQRDNIGDLVLVTPFLAALRTALPDARIDALVNSYNAEVLEGNRDLNEVHVYIKGKHRSRSQSLVGVYWQRAQLWLLLRRNAYDLAVLMAGRFTASGLRPVLAARIPHVCGYSDGSHAARRVDLAVDEGPLAGQHVVERSRALLATLLPRERAELLPEALPPCRVQPAPDLRERARTRIAQVLGRAPRRLIAVHISARKVRQRWPAQRFIEAMRTLHARQSCDFLLLWAPGSADNPLHPGDDEKARSIVAALAQLPIVAYETQTLPELIAACGMAELMLCSDGGAMHLAAAQAVPIVALFGNSDPRHWHPWGTRYEVLREASHDCNDITVERVVTACEALLPGAALSP